MALMNCPECGKENVSDSARLCPDCGFGISAHIREADSKERAKELVDFHKKNIEERLMTIEMPEYPKHFFYEYVMITACMVGTITAYQIFSLIGGCVGTAITVFIVYYFNRMFDHRLSEYVLALRDFEDYRERELNRQLWGKAYLNSKCPVCNSTNIGKIAFNSKMVSIQPSKLMLPKLGKQYKCYSCKHTW